MGEWLVGKEWTAAGGKMKGKMDREGNGGREERREMKARRDTGNEGGRKE